MQRFIVRKDRSTITFLAIVAAMFLAVLAFVAFSAGIKHATGENGDPAAVTNSTSNTPPVTAAQEQQY